MDTTSEDKGYGYKPSNKGAQAAAAGLGAVGSALSAAGGKSKAPLPSQVNESVPQIAVSGPQALVPQGSFKKGGIVPKTAIYKLHKGELVVPKHKVDAMSHDILSGKAKPEGKVNVIHIKKSHEGKLHSKLGEKKGKKLTLAEEEKAKHSGSPAERKEATFAINARRWNHKK
jgi:hypothetical protein